MSAGGVSFEPKIVLRPRSLDESVDLALLYATTHHRQFLRLVGAVVGPALALLVIVRVLAGASWGVTLALTLVLAPLVERTVIAYSGAHLFGNQPTLKGAMADAFRRPVLALVSAAVIPLPLLPAMIDQYEDPAWITIATLGVMFWPFLLAPAVYMSPVAILERLSFRQARRRAWSLISARTGRAIAFLMASITTRIGAVLFLELSARFLITGVFQLGEPIDTIVENQGSWPAVIGYLCVAPVVALVRLLDYVDTRTRLEGWDIQVRFKAAVARSAASRARRITR